jgi:hypothetical protein
MKYENRYNTVYTFTLDIDNSIIWEGEFKWCRFAWPNVYDKAYEAYCADVDSDERMTMGEFKTQVHAYDADTFKLKELGRKYASLIYSDSSKISMIDPSGGPYITSNMDMGHISPKFIGMIVDSFQMMENGYRIIIKDEPERTDSKGST